MFNSRMKGFFGTVPQTKMDSVQGLGVLGLGGKQRDRTWVIR